jgi:hypothetical protein
MYGYMRRLFFVLLGLWVFSLAPRAWAESWDQNRIQKDLEAGRPLVVHVTVALCSNDQIDCGSKIAGRPGDPDHNIYWGAIFGARRFLDRRGSEFVRVSRTKIDDVVLERAVYRRKVPAKRWGLVRTGHVEQLVVLDAVHGRSIDEAVLGFWGKATAGQKLRIDDGEREREVRIQVAGYVGHNRMMDGLRLPDASTPKRALPSFVLACYSEQYFGDALANAGSKPLVMTRQLMAPEGYVLYAVLSGIGDGLSQKDIRQRTVQAYAKWSKLPLGQASWIFSRAK